MANPNAKHSKNVEGAWYCTDPDDDGGEGCIACNVCYTSAEDLFGEDDDGNDDDKQKSIYQRRSTL